MKDLGLLILRLTLGTLMAGHGSQKLFGWFKGPGRHGTAGFMESLGMQPGHIWGTMAGAGEFTGGILTGLGFLNPFGPLNIMAAMAVAIRRVHWKFPLWASQGGAELPMMNIAAALTIAAVGPGRYSVDHILGIRIPRWLSVLATLSTAATTYAALQRPEMAETVLTKATSVMPGTTRSTGEPGLEVETVPTSQESTTPQPAG